jgi:RNase P subunit RPR2
MSDIPQVVPAPIAPTTKTAFCVKCRHKVPLTNPTVKINSRGVKMLQDKCPECASVVNTFVKKDPPVEAIPPPLVRTDSTML